jgi:DNA-binding CsgD family transcriptional regulator
VIQNRAVAVFPLRSVAVQVTAVLPILKRLPDLGAHAGATGPSRSTSNSRSGTVSVPLHVSRPAAPESVWRRAPRGRLRAARAGRAIEHVSPPARTLLRRWFGDAAALPPPVDDWLRAGAHRTPLRLARGGRILVVEAATARALVVREEPAPPPSLTPRGLEILRLVAEGKSTAQIAQELWVTPATVSKHLEHSYRKLGVQSRTAALAAAGLTSRPAQ